MNPKNKNLQKQRLDQLLQNLGLPHIETRQKAQSLIMQGQVLVNEVLILKPGTKFDSDCKIRIKGDVSDFVSRGAIKLQKAVHAFEIDVNQKTCMDIGASTGGFTQILLNHGAQKIYAIDVGYNQLDWKIRNDPRVVVIENCNARSMDPNLIIDKVDLIVMDVSFISVLKIIPHIKKNFTHLNTKWVILIKPQFEAGPENVDKGGIVKNSNVREAVVKEVLNSIKEIGLIEKGLIESPIKGTKGNVEFLAFFSVTMIYKYRFILIFLILFLASACQTQSKKIKNENEVASSSTNQKSTEDSQAPSLSNESFELSQNFIYVASGGGARSFAHIGILKSLSQLLQKQQNIQLNTLVAEGLSVLVAAIFLDSASIYEFEWKILKLKNEVLNKSNLQNSSIQKRSQLLEKFLEELFKQKKLSNYKIKAFFGYLNAQGKFISLPKNINVKEQIMLAVSDKMLFDFEKNKINLNKGKQDISIIHFAKCINSGALFMVDTQAHEEEDMKMLSDYYFKPILSQMTESEYEKINEIAYKGERESMSAIKNFFETMSVAK